MLEISSVVNSGDCSGFGEVKKHIYEMACPRDPIGCTGIQILILLRCLRVNVFKKRIVKRSHKRFLINKISVNTSVFRLLELRLRRFNHGDVVGMSSSPIPLDWFLLNDFLLHRRFLNRLLFYRSLLHYSCSPPIVAIFIRVFASDERTSFLIFEAVTRSLAAVSTWVSLSLRCISRLCSS